MAAVRDFAEFLQEVAPLELAEDWDNVGLLVGDPDQPVQRAMTCLTLSPDVADEAVQQQVQLVVSHHPIPFRPLAKLTTDQPAGRVLWHLIRHGVSIYSAHTAYDSARSGINQQLAERLKLTDLRPIDSKPMNEAGSTGEVGTGRIGRLAGPQDGRAFVAGIKKELTLESVHVAGLHPSLIERVALACGSGSSLLRAAIDAGCDAFITGDIGFHHALEAKAEGLLVVAIGHYASERFAMEGLAQRLAARFPRCTVWPSRSERDPFEWC